MPVKAMWRVEIWESDRWSGQKHFADHDFDSQEEALAFYRSQFDKNDEPYAPDWYTFPKKPRLVEVGK